MAFKHLLEIAARGGIVGGTVMMTKIIGFWGTPQETDLLLQRAKERAAKSYQLAKIDPIPILDYIKSKTQRDTIVKKYNEGIKKAVELLIITPDIVMNLAINANQWTQLKVNHLLPLIRDFLHSAKQKVSDDVKIINELEFPIQHDNEEEDGQKELVLTEDLPEDVQKVLEQQEDELYKAKTSESLESKDDDHENDDEDDMGLILGALASTLKIITLSNNSSDIHKKNFTS